MLSVNEFPQFSKSNNGQQVLKKENQKGQNMTAKRARGMALKPPINALHMEAMATIAHSKRFPLIDVWCAILGIDRRLFLSRPRFDTEDGIVVAVRIKAIRQETMTMMTQLNIHEDEAKRTIEIGGLTRRHINGRSIRPPNNRVEIGSWSHSHINIRSLQMGSPQKPTLDSRSLRIWSKEMPTNRCQKIEKSKGDIKVISLQDNSHFYFHNA
ncbi:hypothetical protein L484_013724 [Morus notabilis]|uniref:Uncharacterized protein n=1 Tax=Morus notabilis TaxID=981085 RepID=W9R7Y2_9ROSA|nr:hypothetical protein L484_013724 [Morus notabilis]